MMFPVKSAIVLVGSTFLFGLTFGDAILSKASAQSQKPSTRSDSSSSAKLSEVGKATTLPGAVNRLTFGLDGKRLIVECAPPPPTQPRIQGSFIFLQPGPPDIRHTVWDLTSHRVVSLKAMAYSYGGNLLAPDLRTLAVWRTVSTSRQSAPRAELEFHDVASQRKVARPKVWKWLGDKMEPLAFSADGKTVAVKAEANHGIVLIDVETGKSISKIRMDDDTWLTVLPGVVFSGDGKVLAVPLMDAKALALCDIASGKVLRKFEKFDRGWVLALTNDGKILALGDPKSDEVRVWDVATGKELGVCEGLKGGVNDLAFSGNGKVLFAANDRDVVAWDVAAKREIARLRGHRHAVTVLAVSPDGKRLASGGKDKAVRLWDISAYAPESKSRDKTPVDQKP